MDVAIQPDQAPTEEQLTQLVKLLQSSLSPGQGMNLTQALNPELAKQQQEFGDIQKRFDEGATSYPELAPATSMGKGSLVGPGQRGVYDPRTLLTQSPRMGGPMGLEPVPGQFVAAPAGQETGGAMAASSNPFVFSAMLHKLGVPSAIIDRAVAQHFPQYAKTTPEKPLTMGESSKMFFWDPKSDTIEPFSSLGEESTRSKAQELRARELSAGELQGVSALRTVDTALEDFKAAAKKLANVPALDRTAAAAIGGTNPLNTRAFIAADKLTGGAWSQYHSARLELGALLAHIYGLGTRGASSPQLETMISNGLGTILDQPGNLKDRFSSLENRITGLKKAAKEGAFGTRGMLPPATSLFAPAETGKKNRLDAARKLLEQGIDLNAEAGGSRTPSGGQY